MIVCSFVGLDAEADLSELPTAALYFGHILMRHTHIPALWPADYINK